MMLFLHRLLLFLNKLLLFIDGLLLFLLGFLLFFFYFLLIGRRINRVYFVILGLLFVIVDEDTVGDIRGIFDFL